MAASAEAGSLGSWLEAGRPDLGDLPPPNTVRWVARRKAMVVGAVRENRLTLDEACSYYRLSAEEFIAWERMIERHGVPGLRVTRLRRYRN